MKILRCSLACTAALALGACASSPGQESILDMEVEEIVNGAAFSSSADRHCPPGAVKLVRGQFGRLDRRPASSSCVPEEAVQSLLFPTEYSHWGRHR